MNHAANGERLHKLTPKRAQQRDGEVYEVDTTILPGISVRGRFSGDGLCGVGAVAVWRGIGRGKHRRGVVGQRFFLGVAVGRSVVQLWTKESVGQPTREGRQKPTIETSTPNFDVFKNERSLMLKICARFFARIAEIICANNDLCP